MSACALFLWAAAAFAGPVSVGDGRISGVGAGDPARIEAVGARVAAQTAQLTGCFELRREADPELGGTIALTWTVRDGKVVELRIVANDTGDVDLTTCVTNTVHRWTFPPGPELQVWWPFAFEKDRR